MPGKPRVRHPVARKHLEQVAAGTAADTPVVFHTAPLPGGVRPDPWDVCRCGYERPQVGGKVLPQRLDPAWQWTEDPPLNAPQTKRAVRPEVKRLVWGAKKKGVWLPPLYPLGGFHSGDPRYDQPGFLDFLLWSPTGAQPMVRELKRMGRSPDLAQATHMTSMHRTGCFDVGLWRTCCLLSGTVSRELAAFAGLPLHPLDEFAPRLGKATGDDWVIGPAVTPVPVGVRKAHAAAVADQLAPRRAAPARPPGVLPGSDVPVNEPGRATGYVIGVLSRVDGDQADNDALNAWLRSCGLTLADVPYPINIVGGTYSTRIQVRPADLGADRVRARVWRAFTPTTVFPNVAVHRLTLVDGGVVHGPSPDLAAALIRTHPGNRGVPAETGVAQ